jgi:hypothetical protein
MSDTTAGQLSATWQGLAQIPQLLADVKAAVLTLKTLITTPAAAVSTGSPAASGAIVLLGAELAMFLAQTVQAVEDDIDGLRRVTRNYETNEADLAAAASRGCTAVDQVGPAPRPALGPAPTTPRPAPVSPPGGGPTGAPRTGSPTTGGPAVGTPRVPTPQPAPRPAPRPAPPASRPVPTAPAPSGAAAVDPARRDDLLEAGRIAIGGLVDVVGARLEPVPPPCAPRTR